VVICKVFLDKIYVKPRDFHEVGGQPEYRLPLVYHWRNHRASYRLGLRLDSRKAFTHAASPLIDGPDRIYALVRIHTTDDICHGNLRKILSPSDDRAHRHEVSDGNIPSTCCRTSSRMLWIRRGIEHHCCCKSVFGTNSDAGIKVWVKVAATIKIRPK
jgi:hypothetical protein